MTKKNVETKVIEYNPKDYISFENKYIQPVANWTLDFSKNLGKTFYGVIAVPFRIPTATRKFLNRQTMMSTDYMVKGQDLADENGFTGRLSGFIIGLTLGLASYITYPQITDKLSEVVPHFPYLNTVLATNIASGVYEIGRRKQSKIERQEYLALKEQRKREKAEKAKKNNK
ncbi:hypothetical protein ACFLZJ_01365 [Nanoarchaeota archaeon]